MSERTQIANQLMHDIERLSHDIEAMNRIAKIWPQQGKAINFLKLLRRDVASAHAHCMSMSQELAMMDSQRERLNTVGGVHRPDSSFDDRPSSQFSSHSMPGIPSHTPPPPVPDVPHPPVVQHASPPQPEAEQPHSSKLASMVKNLPPDVERELREKGLI